MLPGQLPHVVHNTVFIFEIDSFKPASYLVAETEGNAGVDYRLALEHVLIVGQGNMNISKDFQVGFPAELGTGSLSSVGDLL